MSGYALTPLANADIFDIWSYIAEDNQDAAGRVEQAIYDACAFLAEGPLRGHFPARSHDAAGAVLDAHPLSQLQRCLPAGYGAAPNRRRAARQKKYPPHPSGAPLDTAGRWPRKVHHRNPP